jgi:hypothetical protein
VAWPQSQDYNEAIQNPQSSFGDPELRGGQAVTNALGMPMPRSGNFADVYEFVGASGSKWALKCFTREVSGLQEAYREISKQLEQTRLPFMVDFQYLAMGLRIRGQRYPVLKMHWVEGFLLNEFVRNNLHKPARLEALIQVWLRMAKALRQVGIAHADLQHGNVILVSGRKESSLAVRLIDYDGMFVPALANRKSGEVGHPAYQHPQRLQQGTYNAEVDRLPLLAITCALRALVIGGKALWDRFDNGDNLLFREADLRNPPASPLFRLLWNMPDASIHDLTGYLTLALAGPMGETPLLKEVFVEDRTRPLTPTQEQEVSGVLGAEAKVNPPISTAVRLPGIPVSAGAVPPGDTVSGSHDVWDRLGEQTSGVLLTRPKIRSNKKVLLTVAAFVVTVLAGLGIFFATERVQKSKNKNETIYLSDLPPMSHVALELMTGKVSVSGKSLSKSLFMHPQADGPTFVRFVLPRAKKVIFKATVGISEAAQRPASPLTFQVFGDCRLLWTAKPIQDLAVREDCAIDISSIEVVELRVSCSGSHVWAHGIWLDPRLDLTGVDEQGRTGKVFLSEMQEIEVKMGPWRFGKGDHGNPEASHISLGEEKSPHGLGMHPPENGIAFSRYSLKKAGTSFHAKVVIINGSPPPGIATASPVQFQVFGDGKPLWQSEPSRLANNVEECNVGIEGVDVLTLCVRCFGSSQGAHAVWWEPHIEKN